MCYSHARSSSPPSPPPKIPLTNLLFESWIHWKLYISDSSLHSCIGNEPWNHTWGSFEIFTSSVSLNWCKCLWSNFISSKIFNLTKYRVFLLNIHYSLCMQEGQFEFDTSYRNNLVMDSLFFQKIINSLIESCGGTLDVPWLLNKSWTCFLVPGNSIVKVKQEERNLWWVPCY